MVMKKSILIILGRYLPGYKGGGPGRSIANLVDELGDQYNFFIACYDRDLGDIEPYKNIETNEWNKVGKAQVWYVKENNFTIFELRQLYKEKDLIYLCGCFNDYAIKTLLLNRIGSVKAPVVVAAMGLFSPLAFKLKYRKKKAYVDVFNFLGVFDRVSWSVSTERELAEVGEYIKVRKYFIARDLPRKIIKVYAPKYKKTNEIRIIFLSRISPKKNLKYALQVLSEIPMNYKVIFDIYGPNEDKSYWKQCQLVAQGLPKNVQWQYCGSVEADNVIDTFRKYQLFLFPTLGENYGHVILEAFGGGCLCLLSDQTPWLNLGKLQVGRALPLNDKGAFVDYVISIAKMDANEYDVLSQRAVDYAIDACNVDELAAGYINMFNSF